MSIPRRFFLVLWAIPLIHGVDPARAACEAVDPATRYCLKSDDNGFVRCNCYFEEDDYRWVCRGGVERGNNLPDNKDYDCIEMSHHTCKAVCMDYPAYPNFR